jgi:hypothetical protein
MTKTLFPALVLTCLATVMPQALAHAEGPCQIYIEQAWYGAPGDYSAGADVTGQVAGRCDGAESACAFVVEGSLLGDPAPNRVKRLEVTAVARSASGATDPVSGSAQESATLSIRCTSEDDMFSSSGSYVRGGMLTIDER